MAAASTAAAASPASARTPDGRRWGNSDQADDWSQKKLKAFDEPAEVAFNKPSKSKKKTKRSLAKVMPVPEEAQKPAISEEAAAAKSLTISAKFLKFLNEFQDDMSSDKTFYFEAVAVHMKECSVSKLTIPYRFVEQYDGNLAIEIQDQYPSIHDELLKSVVTYLRNLGFDENDAELVELEITNLPELKSETAHLDDVPKNIHVSGFCQQDSSKTHSCQQDRVSLEAYVRMNKFTKIYKFKPRKFFRRLQKQLRASMKRMKKLSRSSSVKVMLFKRL